MVAPALDTTSPPPDERLHAAIRDLRARFGEEILADRRRLTGLLGDHVPEARREIRLIGLSMDDGLPAELRRLPADQLPLQVQRLATRLETHYGIGGAYARWAVAFWLRTLAIAPPEGFEAGPCAMGGTDAGGAEPVTATQGPPTVRVGADKSRVQAWSSPLRGLSEHKRTLALAGSLVLGTLVLGLWSASLAPEDSAPVAETASEPSPGAATEARPEPVAVARAAPNPPMDEVFTALGPLQGPRTPEATVTHVPGRVLTTRFTVPGSPIRYTVTLRPEAGVTEWLATDSGGRRSRASGSLDRGAPDASGGAWDWSRVAWQGENGLGLGPLCLAVQAGRPAGTDPDGGLVCLYDQTCAASYGCLRMRTR